MSEAEDSGSGEVTFRDRAVGEGSVDGDDNPPPPGTGERTREAALLREEQAYVERAAEAARERVRQGRERATAQPPHLPETPFLPPFQALQSAQQTPVHAQTPAPPLFGGIFGAAARPQPPAQAPWLGATAAQAPWVGTTMPPVYQGVPGIAGFGPPMQQPRQQQQGISGFGSDPAFGCSVQQQHHLQQLQLQQQQILLSSLPAATAPGGWTSANRAGKGDVNTPHPFEALLGRDAGYGGVAQGVCVKNVVQTPLLT